MSVTFNGHTYPTTGVTYVDGVMTGYGWTTQWYSLLNDAASDFAASAAAASASATTATNAGTAIVGSGLTIRYSWDTGTTDANPGAGLIRANNAALASATFFYASTTDAAAADVTSALAILGASGSAVKAVLSLRHRTDGTKWALYNVTGVTAATGYDKIAVTYASGSGTLSASDSVVLGASVTGDKGATGTAGTPGGGSRDQQSYVATAGQTVFAASYTAPYLDVFLNGVRLINTVDFTATNGTSITLTVGATLNDRVDTIGYTSFGIGGAVSPTRQVLAGTGMTGGGNLSSDITLTVDYGTTANKIVRLDSSAKLPAVNGSQLTNLPGAPGFLLQNAGVI